MWYEILFQLIYMTASAVFVVAVWWTTLRLMDWALGVRFKDVANNLSVESAIYYGARLIATAWLFSGLLRLIF
jgi:hypothetical protein